MSGASTRGFVPPLFPRAGLCPRVRAMQPIRPRPSFPSGPFVPPLPSFRWFRSFPQFRAVRRAALLLVRLAALMLPAPMLPALVRPAVVFLAVGLSGAGLTPAAAQQAAPQTNGFPPAPASPGLPGALPAPEPWQPVEQVKTYAIRGSTGIDLYRSIGERGPAAGVQAIAHTSFKLTWTRDYRPQPDGSCVLAVAKPKLVITYTLPRAPAGLPPVVEAKWRRFVSGVEKHERVHGEQIVAMVRGIEAFSRGLRAEDDRACRKVREKLQARLKQFSDERVRQSSAFDQVELTEGGAVHQLILSLVNSPDF